MVSMPVHMIALKNMIRVPKARGEHFWICLLITATSYEI